MGRNIPAGRRTCGAVDYGLTNASGSRDDANEAPCRDGVVPPRQDASMRFASLRAAERQENGLGQCRSPPCVAT